VGNFGCCARAPPAVVQQLITKGKALCDKAQLIRPIRITDAIQRQSEPRDLVFGGGRSGGERLIKQP
jgi:hypothetical protein